MSTKQASPKPLLRWIRAGALIVFVSAICYFAGGMLIRHFRDLSPAQIRAKMSAKSLPLDTAIDQLNRLDVRERRDVMQSPEAQTYFQSLKPDQRLRLVKQTLDRGIQDQIDRFRNLKPEEKQAFIEEAKQRQAEAREQMKTLPEDERAKMRQMIESSNIQEVVEKAVQTYLSMTSSAERAELAPLFDGALENLNFAKGL